VRFDRAWFETLTPVLAADPLYARISGHLTARLLFEADGRSTLVRLEGGRIAAVQAPPPLMASWDFALRGDASAWDDLLAPVPPPRCQSVFALAKAGRMHLEGNWLVLMQNLWAVTCLLAIMRAHDAGAPRAAA
jgi:hypothetical protein